jgi:hypothetical protein
LGCPHEAKRKATSFGVTIAYVCTLCAMRSALCDLTWPTTNVKNMLIILLIIIFGYFSIFSIFFLRNEKKYFTLRAYYSPKWLKQI